MACRQFGNSCHALLTNIKRTVCFPLLSRAVHFSAASLALYGTTTAGREMVIKLKGTSSFTLCTSDKHMWPRAERSVSFALCTQYSLVGKHWWMYPEAVWFCFKTSLDEGSKNIPCYRVTIWQNHLLWHVNIEPQPKWKVVPQDVWILIIDIFTKLLWKAWEIKA